MEANKPGNRRILVIDDDEAICTRFRTILKNTSDRDIDVNDAQPAIGETGPQHLNRSNFQVDSALKGEEALENIRQALHQGRPYAIVFVDVGVMPGWNVVETIQQIWLEDPWLQIVACTTQFDYQWNGMGEKLTRGDQLLILKKPFDNIEVCQLASVLSAKWSLSRQAELKSEELEKRAHQRAYQLASTNEIMRQEITERKRIEEDLKQANEKLIKYDQFKNDFAVNVSHELRTPLTIFKNIISNLQAGVKGDMNSRQVESLAIADKEIDRLAKIISDFVSVSEFEADKIKCNFERLAIQPIVDDVKNLLTPLTDKKNIELETSMPEMALFVRADRDKIIQILIKLVDNAIKFVPDSGGHITIRVKDLDDEIGIDVEDNGPGVRSDDISKVFNRFVQIERHAGPGSQGLGLGLAICKELVQLHGGRIWVEDTPTGGANFCFVLPRYSEDEPPKPHLD